MTERKKASKQVHFSACSSRQAQNPNQTRQPDKNPKPEEEAKLKNTTQPQNLGSASAIATKTLQRRLRTPASLPQGFPSPPRTSFARAQTARPRSFVREPR
jgi:hypothetical protein